MKGLKTSIHLTGLKTRGRIAGKVIVTHPEFCKTNKIHPSPRILGAGSEGNYSVSSSRCQTGHKNCERRTKDAGMYFIPVGSTKIVKILEGPLKYMHPVGRSIFHNSKPVQWNATLWPSDKSEDSTEDLDFSPLLCQDKRGDIKYFC